MPKNIDLTSNLEQYIIEHSTDLSNIQKEIINYNKSLGDKQRLQISISQAQFLQILIESLKIKKILEIGSFTGFSALSMSLALPEDGLLISLDKDKEISKIAKSFYVKAGETKIKQIIKPALESLKELKKSNNYFDLVFIDADKENYINYYNSAKEMIKKGDLIIIDNVLWHGEVADYNNKDKFTNLIREFNKHVKNDNNTEQIILPIGDGFTICRKI